MNVLLLHNRYRQPGGEERSVGAIESLLRSRGHRVQVLERSSAALDGVAGRARAGAAMLAGGVDPGEVEAAVRRTGAQVVHAHNLTPLFGARALRAARRAGAAVVLHLHNYRLVCAIAIGYRDGGVCTRCHGRDTWPGVRLRCRGGLAESATYAAGIALHQRRLLESADALVVPSAFARERLVDLGVPAGSAQVLPNFVPEGEIAGESSAGEGEYALFAGRLTEEKGADIAVEAAARSGVPLAIAGSGPQAPALRELAERLGAPVRFLGMLGPEEMAAARAAAAISVVPSRWDEPCPYAAIEAMAAGVPVLASAIGGLPEVVGGETLPPRAVERWAEAMAALWADRDLRRERGAAALARARDLFGEDRFYSGLMRVYESVSR